MTRTEFLKKYEEVVKRGYDNLDGADIWAEFRDDLRKLLADNCQHEPCDCLDCKRLPPAICRKCDEPVK